MVKWMKTKALPVILMLAVMLTMIPFAMFPINAYAAEIDVTLDVQTNPLYEEFVEEEAVAQSINDFTIKTKSFNSAARNTTDDAEYVSTTDDAAPILATQMVIRNNNPVIYFKAPADISDTEIEDLAKEIFNKAVVHNGNPKEGDSLKYVWTTMGADISGYSDGTNAYLEFIFDIGYYTTAQQEEELNEAVEAFKAELNLDGTTDYEKVKAIYDYMCQNITYDYENLEDESYKLKFTAYAALVNKTSVCQGYATLFYRLALEYGIDARVISGTSNGEGHAWNIVKLDGKYYYLDATWDAGRDTYSYFLKGTDNWTDHTADDEYLTEDFTSAYTVPNGDYVYETIKIYTKEDLNNIRNDLSGSYILMNDITFEAADFEEGGAFYNDGNGWDPIGPKDFEPFTGVFDGNGHKISGLVVNPHDCSAGLFGYVSGTVKNLGLVDGTIGSTLYYAGGIVGFVEAGGIIENCYNTSNITTSSDESAYAGGIAGATRGLIVNCYNTGEISGSTYAVSKGVMAGGIVGRVFNVGSVEKCHNRGNVIVPNSVNQPYAGGVVGYLQGNVNDCFNTGDVTVISIKYDSYAGGAVGYVFEGGKASNCYNIGTVSAGPEAFVFDRLAGGAVGYVEENGTVTNCYYLAGSGDAEVGCTELTITQMNKEESFVGFDFTSTWAIDGSLDYKLPHFKSMETPTVADISSYSVDEIGTQTFTGELITPAIVVKNGNSTLVENKDYTVEYIDNEKVGNATVIITGVGNYKGVITKNFVIAPVTMTGVTSAGYSGVYDGRPHGITVTAPEGAVITYISGDNILSSSSPTLTDVGTLTVRYKVEKYGHETITGSEVITITSASILDKTVSLEYDTVVYDGTEKQPTVTVDGLKAGDFMVSYTKNLNVGIATVTITGTDNYDGVITKTFEITPARMYAPVEYYSGTYDGKPHSITVSVPEGAKITYSTSENGAYTDVNPSFTDVGQYKVYFKVEKENYITVTNWATVDISHVLINGMNASLEYDSVVYDGTLKTPKVTVEGLSESNYRVEYFGNQEVGTATVYIVGTGNCAGFIVKEFKIKPIPISSKKVVLSNDTYTYDGKAKKPTVTISGLTEGIDFTVSYKNNTKVGTATAVITGKGYYEGTVTKTFTIKAAPQKKNPFTDVKKDAYYYDAVLWAVEKGVTSGIDATHFGPDYECTRGQVVTFLWRSAGEPKANVKNPFKDVKSDQYYYDAVLWAVEQGITTGTSANTFSPDYTVNRGQFVTFLWRMQGEPDVSVKNPFKDVKSNQYYYDAVLWAYKTGVTTGTSANTFSPDYACLRGQVVTFIYRALG